jgi:predicted AAA+ superfamily ATPase
VEKRYLFNVLSQDALKDHKIAIISGPRQVGKTTLAKAYLGGPANYFTWDDDQFRKAWMRSAMNSIEARGDGPVVLDEIHKDRKHWKQKLKGIYDQIGDRLPIIVTGSARQDIYRKGSDSLMGRYIPYRLHPYSVAENPHPISPDQIFQTTKALYKVADLLTTGGFPEPFFAGSQQKAMRWSRLRLERLVHEDVNDIQSIQDVNLFQVYISFLNERVGSLLSINSLREDCSVAYGTAYQWLKVLEALYYCFLVRPYAKRIPRSLSAQPKVYLFDILRISDPAKRLENLAALHLLKCCQYWTDTAQGEFELYYLRTKDKREVDFCVTKSGKPWMLVECKSNKEEPSPNLIHFSQLFGTMMNFQLVTKAHAHRNYPGLNIQVIHYDTFFAGLV